MRFSLVLGIVALSATPTVADERLYLEKVKPLLAERCASCHGALKQKAKLRLDTANFIREGGRNGPALVAGESAKSLLMDAVLGRDRPRMPPERDGVALTDEQIALLKRWIDSGAHAPKNEAIPKNPLDHWAFRKPLRPAVPTSTYPEQTRNPIDCFINARWVSQGLSTRPETDKATLLRRVSLDLIGLPPTREQLRAFLADDSDDAYERVVARLLASPQYGERWGRHWMDVWRYSDWYGRRQVSDVRNSAPQIWRWRDWIVRSLNADHGYDRMVREMIAADELVPEDYEAGVATGYLIRNWYSLNPNDWMRNTVEHTGKAFLGLTFNCAHCHDHKYDPIAQVDYFRLRAFFEPMGIRQDRVPGQADPGLFQEYKYGGSRKIQRLGAVRIFDKKPKASTWFYEGGDERNRLTERGSISPGVPTFLSGWLPPVEPVELPARAWYPGLRPDIQQMHLNEARATVATTDVKRQVLGHAKLASVEARIAADRAKFGGAPEAEVRRLSQEASRLEREANLRSAETTVLAREQALADAKASKDLKKIAAADKALSVAKTALVKVKSALADKSKATSYTGFGPTFPKTSTGRRRALALWLTSRDNPLTARVAVNHIWMRHFHAPLVASVYDFGNNGSPPTHPALLDWLAVEFMESGWSVKHLHKLIVTSAAYRRVSSVGASQNVAVDPENTLLWRMNSGRMEAEVLRDSLLFCANRLDTKMGGQELENADALTTHRRSLYYSVYPEQGGKSPLGELFDGPDALDCYRRSCSIVPQQALALTNSDLVHQMSGALASRLWTDTGNNADYVQAGFERILSRPPTLAEQQACLAYLDEAAPGEIARVRESLVRVLLNHNDFIASGNTMHPLPDSTHSRRAFLADMGMGFTGLALGAMLAEDGIVRADASPTHHRAKAKSVVWIFLSGGYSHLETFDPKPALNKYAGKTFDKTPFENPVNSPLHKKRFRSVPAQEINVRDVYPTIYPMQVGWRKHGQSGIEVTDWWPHLAKHVDDLCFLRNMWTTDNDHAAENQIHTGRHRLDEPQPSIGAWAHYGLGSLNDNLPKFAVLGGPTRTDTRQSIDSLYLGPQHAGVPLTLNPKNPLPFGRRKAGQTEQQQRREYDLIHRLNELTAIEYPEDQELRARIRAYELAFRMQASVPEAIDLAKETKQTQKLYGIDTGATKLAGQRLLAARRLVERGVRFVQVFPSKYGTWDSHRALKKNHTRLCATIDRPVAGFLQDLKQRGLLDEVTVVFCTEFGRTPGLEQRGGGKDGRDHHPNGFTVWMAGAGLKRGIVHGATDELGYNALGEGHYVTDLHATVLHLLGLNNRRLEIPGRKRLEIDRGHVIEDILA